MKLRKKSRLMNVMTEQLRRAADQAAQFTPDNAEADARIEAEARHEEKVIKAVCDDLGLVMYEASLSDDEERNIHAPDLRLASVD